MAIMTKPIRALPAILAIPLLGVLCFTGCGTANKQPLGSYERALTFQENGKHREAVDAYSQFLRRSPADTLAARAQFEKANSYIALKEYPMAAVEFQILRQEYPTSPYVEEALFRECESLLMQIGRVERDITPALKSRERFLNFLEVYPMSPWSGQVHEHLVEISDLVVRKKLREVDLYRRMKKYEAAAIVLDRTLDTERRTTMRERLYWERVKLARRLGTDEVKILRRMVEELPECDRADEARRRLEELQPAATP